MSIAKFGFYSSLIAATACVGYAISQILQILGLVTYPLDAVLIYGFSLAIAPPFLLSMLAFYYLVPVQKKFWAHAALLFSLMYAIFVMLMYVVQLGAVIPYHVSTAVLEVTPHSLFWTIDALGYINMGLATLFAVPVFVKQGYEKWLRLFFLAHGLITSVVAVVYFYPVFSIGLLMLASPWILTAPGCMITLTIYFKRAYTLS
jgi:hypothetical protein